MKTRVLMVAIAAAGLLGGCLPEKLMVWSPDGRQAAVLGDQQAWLCDAQGKLTALPFGPIGRAAWLPDSRGLLVTQEASAETWAQTVAVIGPAMRDIVSRTAERIQTDIVAGKDPETAFRQAVGEGSQIGVLGPMIVVYLREHARPELAEKLGEKWESITDAKVEYRDLRLVTVADGAARAGATLLRLFRPVQELRVSPDGRNVAYLTPSERDGRFMLWLAPLRESAEPVLVSDAVARYPDWSPDGRSLAYIRSAAREGESPEQCLGSLVVRRVAGADGEILSPIPPEESVLADLLFAQTLTVRWLGEGRLVFAAVEANLPAGRGEPSRAMTLFALDVARPSSLTRVIPRANEQGLPGRSDLFELSPDRKHASVPGDDGRVAVVDLASGQWTMVQPDANAGGGLLTIPAWRTAGELCVGLPPGAKQGSPSRWEAALVGVPGAEGGVRVLSRSWPDEVIRGMLTRQPGTQPATAPTGTKPNRS